MRTFFTIAALCVLLGGCAAAPSAYERAEAVQSGFAARTGCTVAAEVCVDCGDALFLCTLSVRSEGEEHRVSVLAPEELSGVTAVLRGDALSLEYDGLALDAGTQSGAVSATNCVPLFLRAAAEGSISEYGDEDGALRVTFLFDRDGEALYITGWFDGEGTPLRAQIEENGKIIAEMEFTNVVFGAIM